MKDSRKVQQIEKQYVSDDCVQVMFPYKDTFAIFNAKEIVYLDDCRKNTLINKYLDDSRIEQFPYSNIPIHYSKVEKDNIIFANQLLDFEKVYISYDDGIINENFVIKDKDKALLISEELTKVNKKKVVIQESSLVDIFINTDSEISTRFQKDLNLDINSGVWQYIKSSIESYYHMNDEIRKEQASCCNGSIVSIGGVAFIAEDDMKIKYVKISRCVSYKMLDGFYYIVDIADVPIKKYNLDEIKDLPSKSLKDPKISLKLNPNIKSENVSYAKRMSKFLRKTR